MTRLITTALFATLAVASPQPDEWVRFVAPVLSPVERAQYFSLSGEARLKFQEHFWDDKAITLAEFSQRLEFIDMNFGSGRRESGVNTDQGRVYLSLGTPQRITRLPSSRTFVPLEIWYYEGAPSVGVSSELRLLFYQKNGVGLPKLYSPHIDTLRELLLPQAGTIGMFGPNDTINAASIQTQLATRPVENEVGEAALSVSPGIKDEENDTVLLRVMSPQTALSSRTLKPQITSRMLTHRQDLDIVQTVSPYGGTQVDLRWKGEVSRKLKIEIMDADGVLYGSELNVNFDRKQSISYLHRFDLLPGRYTVVLTADGTASPYPLQVARAVVTGEILRVGERPQGDGRQTPFAWAGRHFEPSSVGSMALLPLVHPATVSWIIRQGLATIWKTQTEGESVAFVDLPFSLLRPGVYQLEATTREGEWRTMPLEVKRDSSSELSASSTVSYNANLAAGIRQSFLAHQWMRQGKWEQARTALNQSLKEAAFSNTGTIIELSRLEAATGQLDAARERLRPILTAQPRNFEALATMAYIETKLQDWVMASRFYQQALAVQDSPALRQALARIPGYQK